MSTRTLKYTALYRELAESIDYGKAQEIPLKLNQDVRFEVNGLDVGVKVERFYEGGELMFKPNSNLYNRFNPKTYYNVGFDIEDNTVQTYKTDYKTLAKILGIVAKSTLQWVKDNNPEVVTIIPAGKKGRESDKKLNIYASILQGNEAVLDSIGYYWDKTGFTTGPGVYIAKKH